MECAAEVVHELPLDHIASRAKPKRLGDVILRLDEAEEDDRCSRARLLEGSHRLEPVETGHVDVEHDDVRRGGRRGVDRLAAIGVETDHVEVVGQQRRHPVDDGAMVVGQKHSRLWARPGPAVTLRAVGHGATI